MNAEFIRTFRHQRFTGVKYLNKYEELKQKKSAQTRNVKIPIGKTVSAEFNEVLLYGLRPRDPRIDQ